MWRILMTMVGGGALAIAPLRAQTAAVAEVTIATDRPAVSASSVVVPQGGLQVENGILATNTHGQYVLDLPESYIRYGLLQRTELRLTAPDYFHDFATDGGASTGFGDMAIGVKQQLGPIRGFDVSAIFFLSMPTGASGVSSGGYDPAVQVPWSRKIAKKWTAGGQVAFYCPTQNGNHNFTGETAFYLDRQLSKPWDAFVEYAGDFPERGGSRQQVHFGTAYKLAPHHQIDFHFAFGVSGAAPKGYMGFGYSFLFLTR